MKSWNYVQKGVVSGSPHAPRNLSMQVFKNHFKHQYLNILGDNVKLFGITMQSSWLHKILQPPI